MQRPKDTEDMHTAAQSATEQVFGENTFDPVFCPFIRKPL